MKHVSILIPRGHFSLVNVEGSLQILGWVNQHLSSKGLQPLFDLHLVGLDKAVTQPMGAFTIHPDTLLKDVTKTDMIVLPAIHGDLKQNLEANAEILPWLTQQYQAGAEIVSLCIGSMFLASTGLLNGKRCSTHWQFAAKFRELYPEAILMDDRILTEADGIYTSGGAYSFTNLLLYLIEKYAGRDVAIAASKDFMIDIDRYSQSPFIVFSGQKDHGDELILTIQNYIEENYRERLTVIELSDKFSMGRRTLERRFKKATGNTVIEYLQRVKIEAAKAQLEKDRTTVNEVMYDVGYNDTKAFRDVFRRMTGMSPIDYRNRYSKQQVA